MGNEMVLEAAPTPDDDEEFEYEDELDDEDRPEPEPEKIVNPAPTVKPAVGANHLVISQSKAYAALFTQMRNVNTASADFVKYSRRAMRLLVEDAIAEFPSQPVQIKTPCGLFHGTQSMDPANICAVSIVRSGDSLLEIVRDCIPECAVGKILIQREEANPNKPAKLYYSKMPPSIASMYVLLCDPMLATGASALCALDVLVVQYKVKPSRIIFANMICAPEGVKALLSSYPKVKIVTACLDTTLNEYKFIVPGLGDFGDRYFNTELE